MGHLGALLGRLVGLSWAILGPSKRDAKTRTMLRALGPSSGLSYAVLEVPLAGEELMRAYAELTRILRGAYAPVNKEFHVNEALAPLRHPLTGNLHGIPC